MWSVSIMTEQTINWQQFLQPYELAVNGFVMKLESIKKQYILAGKKNPIESISGRVKSPKSIVAKLKRKDDTGAYTFIVPKKYLTIVIRNPISEKERKRASELGNKQVGQGVIHPRKEK